MNSLSFEEVAKIEKNRIYYSIKKYESLSITIDNYPFIGRFIEIEGDENKLHCFLNEFDFKQKNCTKLFLDYCKQNKLKFACPEKHFAFKDEKTIKNSISKGI